MNVGNFEALKRGELPLNYFKGLVFEMNEEIVDFLIEIVEDMNEASGSYLEYGISDEERHVEFRKKVLEELNKIKSDL